MSSKLPNFYGKQLVRVNLKFVPSALSIDPLVDGRKEACAVVEPVLTHLLLQLVIELLLAFLSVKSTLQGLSFVVDQNGKQVVAHIALVQDQHLRNKKGFAWSAWLINDRVL